MKLLQPFFVNEVYQIFDDAITQELNNKFKPLNDLKPNPGCIGDKVVKFHFKTHRI